MNNFEENYSSVMRECLRAKNIVVGRNGKVRQLIGVQIKADLSDGFPIVTGKKIFPRSIFIETEWMLRGLTNVKYLNDRGVNIWDKWADENGDLGPVYGAQILNFNGIDQKKKLIEGLKTELNSRRHIVTMWNPFELHSMRLPPCHYSFQIVHQNGYLSVVVSMRSLDLFVGLPYDIVMYSTILSSICKELKLKEGQVIINAANAHVYEEHVGAAASYIGRKKHSLPKLVKTTTFSNFREDEIQIEDYNYEPRIKVNVKK
mgnify:CR=1 FL=1|tara:strand:+ start:2350 stop:3129 length:780 start_codon:yes stop_codon:yes gene_type:complete